MSTTTQDVERLARVLCEADGYGPWEGATNQSHYLLQARNAMARGVTLSAPVAPRRTPVQAAVAKRREMEAVGGISEEEIVRQELAAAVGALPGGPQPDECSIGSGMERQLVLRAALLAALTEGGEG